jgi:hypothetical protein
MEIKINMLIEDLELLVKRLSNSSWKVGLKQKEALLSQYQLLLRDLDGSCGVAD